MRLLVLLLSASLALPAAARETRTVLGITYETSEDFADLESRDGSVRLSTGGAVVTVTPDGTFLGVGRIAPRPRESLQVRQEEGNLSIAVDGVVVWRGPAG
ncbi:hypothetical protein BCF33_0410 [Hasllibacter halocynthiae]|uniref:Uncharacterized protein n=1 Tax=Hasllibacter halocynthiae TaxID=595589 RepID=A0A2T0X785_9RHOB|nr:hypothetical protein [Hasllibacter halocynthiae]PRY94810.1 hypothetical protein BCF33_0410 [Hasllibacter halocynthiae]